MCEYRIQAELLPLFTRYTGSMELMHDSQPGGKDNYEADRAAVDAVLKIAPELGFTARENRAFLGRAVRAYGRLECGQSLNFRCWEIPAPGLASGSRRPARSAGSRVPR